MPFALSLHHFLAFFSNTYGPAGTLSDTLRELQAYLFGQAATQTMANVYLYTILVVASFALMLV